MPNWKKIIVSGSDASLSSAYIDGNLTASAAYLTSASIGHLETIYETASVIYSSGSTKFGDTSDDTHEFTGSIYLSGSLAGLIYLDEANGRVGIKTDTPQYPFHYVQDTGFALAVYEKQGGAAIFYEAQDTRGALGTVATHPLIFAINSVEVSRINTSGVYEGDLSGSLTGTASIAVTSSHTAGTASIANNAVTSSHTAGTASIANNAVTASNINPLTQDVSITGSLLVSGNVQFADILGVANEIVMVGSDNSITSSTILSLDPANNYIGINQPNPEVTLHMTGDGAQTAQIRMEQYNDSADAPDVRTRKARGTSASPSKNNAGDFIFRQNSERYNGSTYTTVGQFAVDANSSNADRFQLTLAVSEDGNTIDAAAAQFKIDGNDGGAIIFNDAYKFPTADGTLGQTLITNGSGVLSFGTVSTASHALTSVTSSHTAGTASIANLATTASIADLATTASHALTAVTASHTAGTASIANNAVTASFATLAGTIRSGLTASFADRATSASIADALSQLATASFAITASHALNGGSGGTIIGYSNLQTLSVDYTTESDSYNSLYGPLTIADGVTVTVTAGSFLKVEDF